MPQINLDKYKGKTLDDEMLSSVLADIAAIVDPLEARALKAEDKARKAAQESIEGRKGKDAVIAKALEKLGIESQDDLDSLPDAKGQAEAIKQYEAKLRRAEREGADAKKAFDELNTRYRTERRDRALVEAVSKHQFVDADDARHLLSARLREEGDEFLVSTPDGKLVPLDDGAAWLAKTKPHLVRPAGSQAQGSGFKGGNASGNAGKTITEAEFAALPPARRAAVMADGYQLAAA